MDIMYVPSNLDFAGLSEIYPLNQLPGGKKRSADFLYYFCHQLVHIKAMFGGHHPEHGDYFPICAAKLRRLHFNYDRFLTYLVRAQVLKTDERFIVGEKCTGYNFTDTYSGQPLKPVVLNNYLLKKNIRKQHDQAEKVAKEKLQHYEYLTQWYLCKGLAIDKSASLAWVEAYKQKGLADLQSNGYTPEAIEKERRSIIDTCEGWKLVIDKIDRNDFSYADFTIDDFAGRFHAPLTFMKKELRDFITFGGQKLVSVDIKNCQPYLAIVLMNREFWLPCVNSGSSLIKLQEINPLLYNEISAYPSFAHTITLLDSSESLARYGVSARRYQDLVVSGEFYEFLQEKFLESLPRTHSSRFDTRDKVKEEVLRLFNCQNEARRRPFYGPSRVFGQLFPDVDRVLKFIKSVTHNTLARVLQRVESWLVLRMICKRISAVNSAMPLFTIHDCIVTTVGNEDLMKKTIEQVMTEKIGVPPRVAYEYWLPENLEERVITM